MKRAQGPSPTNRQSFVKPYWLYGTALAILIIFVTYLLVQVYRSSGLLAEANRLSFVQEAKTRLSILNEYFERLHSEVEILSNNRALHAYYQNKALGMSLEYGLAVAVAQIREELERFQKSELAKTRQAFQQIALIDARDRRVVAETKSSSNAKWIDSALIDKVVNTAPDGSTVFDAVQVGSGWAMVAVRPFSYKDEVKGYLLFRLDLRTVQEQLNVVQNGDFHGVVNSQGVLIVGPAELVAKDIMQILAVSPSFLVDSRGIESHSHTLTNVSGPVLVSGGRIVETPFFLVSAAPSSTYLAGYSRGMWVMVFAALLTGLLIIVSVVAKSLLAQSRMFRQLQEARDSLEFRVRERTSELASTTARLQGEVEERTRTERALQASEEKYRTLVEKALEGIVVAENGVLRFVNRQGAEITGYEVEELLGKPFTDFIHPEHAQMVLERHYRRLKGEEFPSRYAFMIVRKDGSSRWVEIDSGLIAWEGKPAVLFFISDITERKELEEAVQEAQMKYQSVVGAFDGLIHIVSPSFEIEFANQRLSERTGYDPVGSKCYEVVHGLHEVCQWCSYEKAANETFRRERLSPKDNRWYYVVSSPMMHSDGAISRIFLMQDIDDQKRSVEEREQLKEQLVQAQKMEAVGTLAGGIAHDFNNLLQVVLGYSQMLLGKMSPDSSQYDAVKKITVAARHAADLVKGLLAFSRKAVSRPRPLDLNHQVVEVKGLLERTIPKMIKIQLRLEEDLSVIHADPGQIEQILMNLGVNARDAMPEGGTLTIETETVHLDPEFCKKHVEATPGDYCMLAVSDTGEGMDKDTLEHIFEPFYTTKDVGKGTGLGLATVYGLVKQHDGFITCESSPGQGTSLKIYFPVVEKEKEELEGIDVSTAPGGNETLLIVDDEDVVRNLGADYLRQAGYTVLAASNGREALEVYLRKRSDISLVILDLIMPEMGGRRCFEELLKINSDVRVLIVSGYSSGGTEKDACELGARGFVGKPYDLPKLLQTIREVLDQD